MAVDEIPTRISPRTRVAVRTALSKAGPRGMSIPELARATGKSYPTIKRTLEALEALADDSYPKHWRLDGPLEKAIQIGESDFNVLVPLLNMGGETVIRWQNARERFAAMIMGLKISEDADVDELLAQFVNGASSMASIAYAIEQVKGYANWYARLGGESDG